jgi:hypothetical protein
MWALVIFMNELTSLWWVFVGLLSNLMQTNSQNIRQGLPVFLTVSIDIQRNMRIHVVFPFIAITATKRKNKILSISIIFARKPNVKRIMNQESIEPVSFAQ